MGDWQFLWASIGSDDAQGPLTGLVGTFIGEGRTQVASGRQQRAREPTSPLRPERLSTWAPEAGQQPRLPNSARKNIVTRLCA